LSFIVNPQLILSNETSVAQYNVDRPSSAIGKLIVAMLILSIKRFRRTDNEVSAVFALNARLMIAQMPEFWL
jgi:hypothetical protein